MAFEEKTQEITQGYGCPGCNAVLNFLPGTNNIACGYCGYKSEVNVKKGRVSENDYEDFVSRGNSAEHTEVITVKCDSCAAATTLKPNVTADVCVFCGSPLVVSGATAFKVIKPEYLLGFKIELKTAKASLKTWARKLWWAPDNIRTYVDRAEKLNGVYLPYWTYDAHTDTSYTGKRGWNRTEKDSKGNSRTVTDWTYVTGRINYNFDDVLIVASKSLPAKLTYQLEPWDLKELVPFSEEYLLGFQSESYQVALTEGFDSAKELMEGAILTMIYEDIGGDKQRVFTTDTEYSHIKFKHILLPVWLCVYKYQNRTFRVMINARTGEVQGERPYSWIKILFALGVLGYGLWVLWDKWLRDYYNSL